MKYSNDLLDQAYLLLSKEPKRPKQASLRRSISACYYAVFHAFIDKGCQALVKSPNKNHYAREILARGISHNQLKEILKSNNRASTYFLPATPPTIFYDFADNLIEQRHTADYDLSETFTRLKAIDTFNTAKKSLQLLDALYAHHPTPLAAIFSRALLPKSKAR